MAAAPPAAMQTIAHAAGYFYGDDTGKGISAQEFWTERVAIRQAAGGDAGNQTSIIGSVVLQFRGGAHTWWHMNILRNEDSIDPAVATTDWAAFERIFQAKYFPVSDRATRVASLDQPPQRSNEKVDDYALRVFGAIGNQLHEEQADIHAAFLAAYDDEALFALNPRPAAPAVGAVPAHVTAYHDWLRDAMGLAGAAAAPADLPATPQIFELLMGSVHAILNQYSDNVARSHMFLRATSQIAEKASDNHIRKAARDEHLKAHMDKVTLRAALKHAEATAKQLPKHTKDLKISELSSETPAADASPDEVVEALKQYRARNSNGQFAAGGPKSKDKSKRKKKDSKKPPGPAGSSDAKNGDGCLFCGVDSHKTAECRRLKAHAASLPPTGDPALRKNTGDSAAALQRADEQAAELLSRASTWSSGNF